MANLNQSGKYFQWRWLCLLLFGLFFLPRFAVAQTESPTDSSKKNLRFIGLPIVFYSPDTKFGFGAAGMFTFNISGDTSTLRRSNFQAGFAYTTYNQLLAYLPFQLFLAKRKYWLQGEIGYYKYVFNYFGIGNEIAPDYLEKYDARFPRIRFNGLRNVAPGFHAGISYAFDAFNITRIDSTGLLADGDVTGHGGGRISSVGFAANFDSRDNIQFPTKGWFLEGEARTDGKWSGSEFEFTRLHFNGSRYFMPWEKHIFAVNASVTSILGDAPFFQLATIGGTKRLRGYFEGKYRDKNAALLQAEYRSPFLWRFGLVAFGGYGAAFDSYSTFKAQYLRFNYGAGLRLQLDQKQKINIRIDYGRGYQSSGFYFTIGEAF